MFHVSSRRRPYGNANRVAEVASLESRELLAGNVNVAVDTGGNVTLTGDSANNSVRITVENSTIIVKGISTTVNGGSAAVSLPLHASQANTLAGSLTVNLGDGNDIVDIANGVGINGNLTVQSGNGDDITVVRKSRITGDLNSTSGNGKDSLTVVDTTISGNLSEDMGSGDDVLISAKLTVGGHVNLLLGDGNDVATPEATTAGGAINIDAGAGNDLVVAGFTSTGFNIQMGAGNDVLMLTPVKTTGGSANISLGSGNDGGGLQGGPIGSTLNVDGGLGTDQFSVGSQAVTQGTKFTSVESKKSISHKLALTNPLLIKFLSGMSRLRTLQLLLGRLP